jgi:hypothetical protein
VRGIVLYGAPGKFTWRMLAAVMGGESIAVFLGALVARGLADAREEDTATTYLVVGLALAVACLLAAGLMRRPWGVTLGWLVHVAVLLSAYIVPEMLVVGLLFLALWVLCLVQGHRIDRLQAQREREAGAR